MKLTNKKRRNEMLVANRFCALVLFTFALQYHFSPIKSTFLWCLRSKKIGRVPKHSPFFCYCTA